MTTAVVIDAAGVGGRLAIRLEQAGARSHDVPSEGLGSAVASAGLLVLELLRERQDLLDRAPHLALELAHPLLDHGLRRDTGVIGTR